MAGAVINPGTVIGHHYIVNTCAVIDHDCELEEFASVGPRAVLAGRVPLGRLAAVGVGAAVIEHTIVGAGTIVEGGSVVVRGLPPNVVAMGVPARVVRTREPNERYLR